MTDLHDPKSTDESFVTFKFLSFYTQYLNGKISIREFYRSHRYNFQETSFLWWPFSVVREGHTNLKWILFVVQLVDEMSSSILMCRDVAFP